VRRIRRGCLGVHTVRHVSYASMCLLDGGGKEGSIVPLGNHELLQQPRYLSRQEGGEKVKRTLSKSKEVLSFFFHFFFHVLEQRSSLIPVHWSVVAKC